MTRRISCLLITMLLLMGVFPSRAYGISTSATSAILLDADSGRVLYEQNADRQMLIASTTKILTALVALREGDLSDIVRVSQTAAYTEGSSMYLKVGEELTLETLLYGLLLCSGNDAAVAIAEHVGGSVDAFVVMMNETAQELGMKDSSFANPNGLDAPTHYSTARDMARLGAAAMKNETLVRMASTRSVTVGGRTMTNHNKLLGYIDGCIGLKTGFTKAAGRTLVSCAEKNGQRLIAVTLQDGNDWADHQALFEYGFSVFPAKHVAAVGQPFGSIPVLSGLKSEATLVAASGFSWPLSSDETLDVRMEVNGPLYAPITAGTQVGEASFWLNETKVGSVKLLCGETILSQPVTALHTLRFGF